MNKTQLIQLFHIFVVASLFIYIGTARTNIPDYLFSAIFSLGFIIILYHSYKIYVNVDRAWLYLIHILVIGPLLIYIGHTGKNTERKFFELLLLLAFATLGYNGFYFLKNILE